MITKEVEGMMLMRGELAEEGATITEKASNNCLCTVLRENNTRYQDSRFHASHLKLLVT